MNKIVHESSIHPMSPLFQKEDDPFQEIKENSLEQPEQDEFTGVFHLLDQVKFSPRSGTIRAIMKYAHIKKEVIH